MNFMNLCEQYFINFRKHCQYIWCWIKCFKMKTSLSIKMKFAKQTWQIIFLLLFLLSSKIYYTFQYPMKFHLKYTREHRCSWNVFKNALIASQPFSTINTLYSLCNVLVPKQCLLSYIWLGHGVKIKPERNCALRATREANIVII
jgi:hypothetical protein